MRAACPQWKPAQSFFSAKSSRRGVTPEGVTHGVEKVLDAPVVFLRPSVVGSSEEGAVLDGGRVRRRAP